MTAAAVNALCRYIVANRDAMTITLAERITEQGWQAGFAAVPGVCLADVSINVSVCIQTETGVVNVPVGEIAMMVAESEGG